MEDQTPGAHELAIASTEERLKRIEHRLGITEPTRSQAELDALLDAEDAR